MKCLINGKIILKNQILENKVLVFDEKIIDIADSVPKDCEVIDADGKYISPGLIIFIYMETWEKIQWIRLMNLLKQFQNQL
ncbi:amidohydrolase family protein [Clostridioides difficile]|uniref:amidohydrolase family protein n=1 Tax=Clostridioides difficile TaxID=1496 RepID=UPI00038D13F6|nr:amidohydrolase family protein [Clostridioides difficile]EQF29115.1 amidohydrolase family protein [Clostridioides difficile CD159]